MSKEKLFLNTLTFDYPSKPVGLYFSDKDDAEHKSSVLKSTVVIPKEVKSSPKYADLFAGGKAIYAFFDKAADGFEPIDINFQDADNENFVKRYYNYKLARYFRYYSDEGIVVTQSGITNDIQVWIQNQEKTQTVQYSGKTYKVFQMDRYTLKIRFDNFNKKPYLLVACDRPAQLLNIPLSKILLSDAPKDPFGKEKCITPSMINKVMTREERKNKDGKTYIVRTIDKYEYLHSHGKYCPLDSTRPIMGKELKQFFGLDHKDEAGSFDSKYIKYYEKIEHFRNKYLNNQDIEQIFKNLAYSFTSLAPQQVGMVDPAKRMLLFGEGQQHTRQQVGVNYGPKIPTRYVDVQLIFIFPKQNLPVAQELITYMRNGGYRQSSKALTAYVGTPVNWANSDFHILFENEANPLPEIEAALQRECYLNKSSQVKYIGIYISPIHKYTSAPLAKECYFKIKELFLRNGIPTQCIDRDKMLGLMANDEKYNRANFTYTLQNMGVAICAKLGGSPWLLAETAKKELVIGIGAFMSDKSQYIGTAFSFDNTGEFNDYQYFQKDEIDELVGAIKFAIIKYSNINKNPERLIIHYFKKMSRKKEFLKIENMLNSLSLEIPVYVVTINKTESEDIVVFDDESTYQSKNYQTRSTEIIKGYMPYSGRYVNLGKTQSGNRYLLCNNTRYEDGTFNKMDGFPFPVKLNIACPNRATEIETSVIQELIAQVYQFSRIYWKSVKQQGLPVTIKYPAMIAEIMPHFDSPTIYPDSKSLWFL